MGLSNELSCEARSFSSCCLNPHRCLQSDLRFYFPLAGSLGCEVCFAPPPFLSVYLCANVGPQGLLAVVLAAPFAPHSASLWVPPQQCESPPTGLDECFFFIFLFLELPCGSIFCQFWLFLFLNCCCPSFGCARRHSLSTYASILVLQVFLF